MKAFFITLICLTGAAAAQDLPGSQNSGLEALSTRDALRGFEPVGRVDIEDGGFCTGALIAPDLVLTAGHCVIELDGTPIDAARIRFRAGLADGAALAEVAVAQTIVDPAFRHMDPAPTEMIARDVALLKLADPIPSSMISPFAVDRPGTGDEVSVVSYGEGREEILSWQRVCHVVGRQGVLIAMDCDTSFGSSGAPVLDRSGYRAKIVSIISAGSEDNGKPISIGMELPAQVDRLKAALRRGDATSTADVPDTVGFSAGVGVDAAGLPGTPGKRIAVGGGTIRGLTESGGARFVSPP